MLEIISYDESFDEDIMAHNPLLFYEIKYHQDVLAESVCIALCDDEYAGVAFLLAGPSFLNINTLSLPYYHIHMEYSAVSGTDYEIDVTDMLLDELKATFRELAAEYPDKRLILRTWCRASSPLSLDYLLYHEFRPMRVTPIMARDLTELSLDVNSSKEYSFRLKNGELAVIKPLSFTDELWSSYISANADAFFVPDSKNELAFKLMDSESHVFGAFVNGELAGSLTTWKIDDKTAATENIFCTKKYEGNGIATALIEYAADFLNRDGYQTASLTVFGDNLRAIGIYQTIGYELKDELLELHYEEDYKNIPY